MIYFPEDIDMLFVKTSDLKPGMRLAKPIYNKTGVLLYERDTKLTKQGISSIENFGLIGIFILEPAEPVPPMSEEDIEFEQNQTIYMFKLKENMDLVSEGEEPASLYALSGDILSRYGRLDHKMNFIQNLRSSTDYVYKHSISVAILCALISKEMKIKPIPQQALITAALLYDYGYSYVPQAILDKGQDLTPEDADFIQMNLERGYDTLRPLFDKMDFPPQTLEIIQYQIFHDNESYKVREPMPNLRLLSDILKVADRFDELTAMNIDHTPISEVAAMDYLRKRTQKYSSRVLAALAECIHILPRGACVDLSDGDKALILMDNPADYTRPMVLKFSNNVIYDLSDPLIGKNLYVVDIMKTMDNRIAVDENTLKQFSSDRYIKKTLERFKAAKLEIARAHHDVDPE
jgi:HD-GYP domain-containing protein (c-di-GMP phosphodiesterase class II)